MISTTAMRDPPHETAGRCQMGAGSQTWARQVSSRHPADKSSYCDNFARSWERAMPLELQVAGK
jgi:hypothetical protein